MKYKKRNIEIKAQRENELEDIQKISPWLWKQCHECGGEFKGSYGWERKNYSDGDFLSPGGYDYYYVCKDCAPDRETAIKLLDIFD